MGSQQPAHRIGCQSRLPPLAPYCLQHRLTKAALACAQEGRLQGGAGGCACAGLCRPRAGQLGGGALEVLPSAYCHSPCTVFPPFACIYALSCFTTRHVTVAPCELHLSQGLSWRVGEVCKALGRAAAAQSMSPFQTRFWTALASIWALQVARNANERRSGRQLAGPSNSAAFWTSRLLSK